MRFCTWVLLVFAGMAFLGQGAARLPASVEEARQCDEQAWTIFRPSMLEFQKNGDRVKFLAICKDLRARFPGSRYEQELKTLVAPMEAEATALPPPYLVKKPKERTQKETIQYWVYQLREVTGQQWSDPGYPMLFNMPGEKPNAADQLVTIGPPAIPYLIKALNDFTPTRTIAWQRSFYPVYFVLRRQDIAMKCLEKITGCRFYEEGATFRHFYFDDPARRQSVLADIAAWWKISEGKSQAQMIRNQVGLYQSNITINGYPPVRELEVLAALEGPEAVIDRVHTLLTMDTEGLNSAIVELSKQLDPGIVVRDVMQRFWAGKSKDGDYTTLLKYGDKAVYEEIVRRYEATGKLDPGEWVSDDQLRWAAEVGKNWAIPLLAHGLKYTEMTGARMVENLTESQPFCTADTAIEEFQRLTSKDFGYRPEKSEKERLAAISAARDWWMKHGRRALAGTIARDHPPVNPIGDRMLTEKEITQRVRAINGNDAALRRKTVAILGETTSYHVQRALLNVLPKEPEPAARLAILRILAQHPQLWHLPALTDIYASDADIAVRVSAGEIIVKLMADKTTMIWQIRLETRETALATARRLAEDLKAPEEVRKTGEKILRSWNGDNVSSSDTENLSHRLPSTDKL